MENIAKGRDEWARSLMMLKFFVQGLKALNQVGHLFSGIGTSGGLAEMGAAAKGTVLVDRAFTVYTEEWTGAIGVGLQFHPARGSHAFGCTERLCLQQRLPHAQPPGLTNPHCLPGGWRHGEPQSHTQHLPQLQQGR